MAMNSGTKHAFAVTAYHAPAQSMPSFALPIVQSVPRGNAVYAQDTDSAEQVIDLVPLDGSISIDYLTQPVPVEVGSDCIYVVVGPVGQVASGTRATIADMVGSWSSQVPYLLSRLSFLEFAGRTDEANAVSSALLRERADTLGSDASSSWFLRAVVYPRLSKLLSYVSGGVDRQFDPLWDSSVDLWVEDRKVNVSIPGSVLNQILSKPTDQHLRLLERVEALVEASLGLPLILLDNREGRRERSRSDDELAIRLALEEVGYIRSLGRQEERMAQTISAICAHPQRAELVASHVRPRARLEANFSGRIRELARNAAKDGAALDSHVEKLVDDIYRAAYPMRRGEMLFEIAHRVRNPGAKRALRRILARTGSVDVALYRSAIEEILG